jgi:heat shock protein HtpX
MFGINGLYGHIERNTAKSVLLLCAFAGLACVFWYTLCVFRDALFWVAPGGDAIGVEARFYAVLWHALDIAIATWWVPFAAATAWLLIAFTWHAALIRSATGAREVSADEYPRLHAKVEALAIAAGLPTPRVEIMPSMQLNAYAAGLGPNSAVIAVTRGLIEELEDDELEAVLAHEMAHIQNRDVRLMVVASLLASGLSMIGTALFGFIFTQPASPGYADDDGFLAPASAFVTVIFAATAVMVAFWLVLAVAAFALAIKFAISRSREFLADAGAVELTKNADALIAALRKISGRDAVPVSSSTVQAMLISFDAGDLFDTHPPVEERIAALQRHAGGMIRPERKPKVRQFGRWGRNGRSGLRNGRAAPIRG